MAAAGLGLMSYQNLIHQSTVHTDTARKWLSEFKNRYCILDNDNNIVNVTLYYDPEINYHSYAAGILMGFGVAWYVLPQDIHLAKELNDGGINAMSILGLLLAQEFGDEEAVLFLRAGIIRNAERKNCSGSDSNNDDGAGYFFHRNEKWPRGQLSALLTCSSILSKGQWYQFFNRTPDEHASQHGRPKIINVDYPYIGLSDARYINKGHTLLIKTYSDMSQHDLQTSFNVIQLPDSSKLVVKRNGALYENWKILNSTSIEIQVVAIEQTFTIDYGASGGRL